MLYHRYSWLQDEALSPKAKAIDTSLLPLYCSLHLDTNFVMDLITKNVTIISTERSPPLAPSTGYFDSVE